MNLKIKIADRFKINFFIMFPMVLGVLLAMIAGLYFNQPGPGMAICLLAFLSPFLIIKKLKRRFINNGEIELNEVFFKIIIDDINKEETYTCVLH
ncbi:MAG: hypothetical protein ABI185_05445 [Ginsengibacter sp.]